MDEASAREILRTDEAEAGAFGKKLELLTKLVEGDLRLDAEPGFVYLLIAFYKEDPRAMDLLPAVCAYEARKYPETRDSAVSYLEMIGTRLEILKRDPAEAERRWAACKRLRPAAHDQADGALRLFELMRRRSGPLPPPGPPKPEPHVSYGAPEPED